MISRPTVIAALVVVELAIVGLALKAVAGHQGPSLPRGGVAFTAGGAPVERLDQTFVTGPSPHVVIDVGNTHVVVLATNGLTVHVTGSIRKVGYVSGPLGAFRAERTADGVRVIREPGAAFVIGELQRELQLGVPAGARVEVASSGRIEASGLRAKMTARVADGSIHIRDHHGDLDVTTGSGRIELVDVQGSAIVARTSDGRILARGVGATDGALVTDSGRISVEFTRNSDATVNVHTGDGSVNVDGIASTDDGQRNRVVRLGSGRGRFEVSSGDGSITITQGANV